MKGVAEDEPPARPVRKKLPHGVPPWVDDGSTYFVTICCAKHGEDQLCVVTTAERIFEAVEFRQARRDWHVHLLLLMPDQLHALVSFGRERSMVKTIANFKEMIAKRTGVRWQRDFFEHRLRDESAFTEKASYIRMNPVRKGLVPREELWPFVWVSADAAAGPAVPPYL